jgi:hypothetical protein
MPQPETHERKASAKQAVLNSQKKGKNTKKDNVRPCKKKRTKKRSVNCSSAEESSDEESQPRKCQRKSLEPEEISATSNSSDKEPETILITEKNNTDHEELEAAIGEEESVHRDVPVRLECSISPQCVP